MKISRKASVKAACKSVKAEDLTTEPSIEEIDNDVIGCKNQKACDLILEAIDALAENASEDKIAKDAIANLSVVLLDLK